MLRGLSLWVDCLIGHFHDFAPRRAQIQAIFSNLWGCRVRVDVLDYENGSFLFKFENKQTKHWVHDSGPWFILQKPLFLQPWELGPVEPLSLQKSPVWIKFWNVPLQLFTAEGLSRLASAVGISLCH